MAFHLCIGVSMQIGHLLRGKKHLFFASLGYQGGRSKGLSSDHWPRLGLSLPLCFCCLDGKTHTFLILTQLLNLGLDLSL